MWLIWSETRFNILWCFVNVLSFRCYTTFSFFYRKFNYNFRITLFAKLLRNQKMTSRLFLMFFSSFFRSLRLMRRTKKCIIILQIHSWTFSPPWHRSSKRKTLSFLLHRTFHRISFLKEKSLVSVMEIKNTRALFIMKLCGYDTFASRLIYAASELHCN